LWTSNRGWACADDVNDLMSLFAQQNLDALMEKDLIFA
jgi:hypothetical protein